MRIKQILESVSAGSMGTNSVATAPGKAGKMIRRQKPSDNALDSGKLFQETNTAEGKEDKIDELSPETLKSYANKARAQVRSSPGANPNNSHLPTDPKIANRARGAVKADNRLNGFGPVKKSTQGVAEEQVDELSKDTLKSYVPKRIEKTKGLAKTDYNKAHHIIKKDIPRAMSKLKDPNYGKEQPTSSVEENKKGVRAVKHTTKPRNFVAKNASATTSGAGAHKDKKKAMKQGETKHKGKEPAYESRLWVALERRIIK